MTETTKENKTVRVSFRMTPREAEQIFQLYAAREGIRGNRKNSPSNVIRETLLKAIPHP